MCTTGFSEFIAGGTLLYTLNVFALFCRLEDASLAICKLQQSLKIKEEKISELETKYALTFSFVTRCLPVNGEPAT